MVTTSIQKKLFVITTRFFGTSDQEYITNNTIPIDSLDSLNRFPENSMLDIAVSSRRYLKDVSSIGELFKKLNVDVSLFDGKIRRMIINESLRDIYFYYNFPDHILHPYKNKIPSLRYLAAILTDIESSHKNIDNFNYKDRDIYLILHKGDLFNIDKSEFCKRLNDWQDNKNRSIEIKPENVYLFSHSDNELIAKRFFKNPDFFKNTGSRSPEEHLASWLNPKVKNLVFNECIKSIIRE